MRGAFLHIKELLAGKISNGEGVGVDPLLLTLGHCSSYFKRPGGHTHAGLPPLTESVLCRSLCTNLRIFITSVGECSFD